MPAKKINKRWFVYLLECRNGHLYTGITTDLQKRFDQHVSGKGAMFTRLNRPSHMLAAKPCKSRSEASKLEHLVKTYDVAKKLRVIATWPLTQNLPKIDQ